MNAVAVLLECELNLFQRLVGNIQLDSVRVVALVNEIVR
jgi:hypothetical protein